MYYMSKYFFQEQQMITEFSKNVSHIIATEMHLENFV